MSHIIEFFENRVPDSEGRMIDDILYENDWYLESTHDWVQWLFPLKEPSQFNPNAPILTDDDIEYFKSPAAANIASNYIAGINRFLQFLGLEANSSSGFVEVDLAEDYEEKSHIWATTLNHNHLRITRMLKSMMLLGFENYAKPICDFLTDYDVEPNSKKFWTEAVYYDEDNDIYGSESVNQGT